MKCLQNTPKAAERTKRKNKEQAFVVISAHPENKEKNMRRTLLGVGIIVVTVLGFSGIYYFLTKEKSAPAAPAETAVLEENVSHENSKSGLSFKYPRRFIVARSVVESPVQLNEESLNEYRMAGTSEEELAQIARPHERSSELVESDLVSGLSPEALPAGKVSVIAVARFIGEMAELRMRLVNDPVVAKQQFGQEAEAFKIRIGEYDAYRLPKVPGSPFEDFFYLVPMADQSVVVITAPKKRFTPTMSVRQGSEGQSNYDAVIETVIIPSLEIKTLSPK